MAKIFEQGGCTRAKTLRITFLTASRYIKRENVSLPVDVSHSNAHLLKLPNSEVTKRDSGKKRMETATKTSLKNWIRVLSIFMAIISTQFTGSNEGELS